jgi:dihydrofolate synthase/folylpolyglutamate synthase
MTPAAPLATALRDLYRRVPMGMRLGLETMRDACGRWGHPEQSFAAVHVAGTNGKGSVCAMVESIARAQGLRTGLYTSPHLCRFAERIRVDGDPIDDQALAALLDRILDEEPALSFFEAATLTAFAAFRNARVDLAVVEVGLGGRLDATNVLASPAAAAITRIAMDHGEHLGPTLVDIAREKAGIAKPGLDIVLGPMDPPVRSAIDEVARAHGATTSDVDLHALPTAAVVGLDGEHQVANARIAASLGRRIGASRAAVETGIAHVHWPGRLERIGPYLVDCAHNPDGARSLARYVRAAGASANRTKLVFGSLADKDWRGMLSELAPLAVARVFVAPPSSGRAAADPAEMSALWSGRGLATVEQALETEEADLVIVAGSILLVGRARALLLGLPSDPPVAL